MEIIARLANLPGALPGAVRRGLSGVSWPLACTCLPYSGCSRPDRGRQLRYRRRGVRHVPAFRHERLGSIAGGCAGRPCYRLVTGLLHTFMGIPAILAGILTQLALYSINLKIMGKANQSINVDKYGLLISLRWVKEFACTTPSSWSSCYGGCYRGAVLVLRYGAGLRHPRYRF